MGTLIVMCGLSGSGKDTYTKKFFRWYDIISTDDIRKEMFGDATCQDRPQDVFEVAYGRVRRYLELDRYVVFNAMNLRARDRKKILKLADECGAYKICVMMAADVQTCIERQQHRDRKVPAEVILKQGKRLQCPTIEEGWDEIHIIRQGE